MINSPASRGHPAPFGSGTEDHRRNQTIATEKLSVEHKIFFLDLQENHRGRCFKITEEAGGRRDTVVIPIEAGPEFLESLKRLICASDKIPTSSTS